jgi:hypothetical protein
LVVSQLSRSSKDADVQDNRHRRSHGFQIKGYDSVSGISRSSIRIVHKKHWTAAAPAFAKQTLSSAVPAYHFEPTATMLSGTKFVVLALLFAAVSGRKLFQNAQRSGDQCFDIDTVVLGRSGVQFGSGVYPPGVYGRLYDANKQPIVTLLDRRLAAFRQRLSADEVSKRGFGRFTADAQLADAYSNGPDFPSFQEVCYV